MNPTIKKLWVDALLSGEYNQGQRYLSQGGTYCCLGVLCDLYRKQTGKGQWTQAEGYYEGTKAFDLGDGLPNAKVLPTPVVEWAGLPDSNPVVKAEFPNGDSLAGVNDNGGSFQDIAAIISAQL